MFLSLLPSEGLQGQSRQEAPTLLLGYAQTFIAQRDEMASPLRYTGSGSRYELGLLGGGTSSFGMMLGYVRPRLTSSITWDGVNQEVGPRVDVTLWYLRPIFTFREGRWRLLGGGQVDLRFATWKHSYTSAAAESFFHGIGFVQGAGGVKYESRSGRWLSYRLAVSLLALGVRNPYEGLDEVSGPTAHGPWNAPGLDQTVVLGIPLREGLDLRFSYRATFFRYPDPRELAVAADRFGVSLGLRMDRGG
jgi:hypothetical protein